MLIFQPEGVSYINKEGESVLESAKNAGIFCENICGGRGTCGKCRVKVEIGEFRPVTREEEEHFTKEELAAGYRLACCLYPKFWFKTCEILIEPVEEKKTVHFEKEGEGLAFFQQRCSMDNRKEEKMGEHGDKTGNWQEVNPDSALEGEHHYGMAVDIGTTNIEGLLFNLENGACVARILQPNPQQKYGGDVVSRIAYGVESKIHFDELCSILKDTIEDMAKMFMGDAKGVLEKVAIAGNATMMHFFAGEDVSGFTKAPYLSTYKEGRCVDGINGAKVYLLPNIESFVGADTVGVLLYLEKMFQCQNCNFGIEKGQKVLIIDIGTNGELILQVDGQNYVSSTSAGPAFEGATMIYGMRAEKGAITGISFEKEKNHQCQKGYTLQVVGEERPKGICGSGYIEIVAKLYGMGVIEKTGYLLSKKEAEEKGLPQYITDSLRDSEYGTAFELYKDTQGEVLLTQKDIRELQLAKGAIVAGVHTMLAKCHLKPEDLDRCYLAGAFGTYLNGECAKLIGLLPDIPTEKIIPIGNGALLGTCRVLLEEGSFELADKMAAEAKHISLSEEKDFRDAYIRGMNLGEKLENGSCSES